MKKLFMSDMLTVKQFDDRVTMGAATADDAATIIEKLQSEKPYINIIFGSAPSQDDVLAALVKDNRIDWKRVRAYHLDEYVGLDKDNTRSFANYLKLHVIDNVDIPADAVHYINTVDDVAQECETYTKDLLAEGVDVVFLGIGENGHIAFNDPDVADFNDPKPIKQVLLDDKCRQQQVNDKCFDSFDEVPKTAVTLTIPTIMSGDYLFCTVPGPTKAVAVAETLEGDISEKCPASILRRHKNAILYIDKQSASKLKD